MQYNKTLYSAVSVLAVMYSYIVTTSDPCKRLFSEAGQITQKKVTDYH